MLHHSIIGHNMLKVKGFLPIFCNFFRFNSNTQSFLKITCSHKFTVRPSACIVLKYTFVPLLHFLWYQLLKSNPIYCIKGIIISVGSDVPTFLYSTRAKIIKNYLNQTNAQIVYIVKAFESRREVPREQNI